MYNPANDPEVINGMQEGYGFKVGDIVTFTNPAGIKFAPYKVVGFRKPDPDCLPDNVVYINSDSPWYPVKASQLEKCTETLDLADPSALQIADQQLVIALDVGDAQLNVQARRIANGPCSLCPVSCEGTGRMVSVYGDCVPRILAWA